MKKKKKYEDMPINMNMPTEEEIEKILEIINNNGNLWVGLIHNLGKDLKNKLGKGG